MTGTELSLLRSVLLDPGDDTPRLVYADWLDERAGGYDPRAEFVRVQCELSRTQPGHDSTHRLHCCRTAYHGCRVHALELLERELFKNYSQVWVRSLADQFGLELLGWAGSTCGHADPRRHFGWLWHRGFIDEIRLPLAAFVGAAGELFSRHPITRVVPTDREPADRMVINGCWYWLRSQHHLDELEIVTDVTSDRLPGDVFGLLSEVKLRHTVVGVPYDTRDAALSALSAACVAYGRSQVDWLSEHDAKKELASVAI